ncbi:hypothetical protein H9635_03095 [Solibacillus sp. A46]|uniref:DUF8042 domain-containing protein n=1 Tax=Solibacillus faecavium TaxID=2762221 RepID=A0ABR8XUU5_9BACL|nr:hypothetical protein [Solibacillus faecavium]MBD8035712.1 hypothetical protein [Solibacillus faecavium]
MNESREILELEESVGTYLKNVPNGVIYIANSLKEDELYKGLKAISDFSEGMMWLNDATRILKNNGKNIFIDFTKIEIYLVEINEGLEKEDYLLVADLFEYEISPFFQAING